MITVWPRDIPGLGTILRRPAAAIRQMIDQTGAPVLPVRLSRTAGKGVIIRHMVLPGQRRDSIALLEWISGNLPGPVYDQPYEPVHSYIQNQEFPELNRRITSYEYDKVVDALIRLGLTDGSCGKKQLPGKNILRPFDFEGI